MQFDYTILFPIAIIGAIGVLVAYILLKVRNEKIKFGIDEMPIEIQDVIKWYGDRHIEIERNDFVLEVVKGNCSMYSKRYACRKGTWELKLEFCNEICVGYSAQYYSRFSSWLNATHSRCRYPAKILMDNDSTI